MRNTCEAKALSSADGQKMDGAPGLAADGTDKGGFVKAIGGEGDLVINSGKW